MAERTAISWADATVNWWWGCTAVSDGCANCYAERIARRRGVGWGPKAGRVPIKGAWDLVARLQGRAEREGRRLRVFTNSMSDFFDAKGPDAIRAAAWEHIRCATALDFLILTKRPLSIPSMLPRDWGDGYPNVWLGVSAENQEQADARIPTLLTIPAPIHWVSAEPLLGPVDLMPYLVPATRVTWGPPDRPPAERHQPTLEDVQAINQLARAAHRMVGGSRFLDWVVVGGESGPGHRRMDVGWLESIVDQCRDAGVPAWVKQDSGPRAGQIGRIGERYWVQENPQRAGAAP